MVKSILRVGMFCVLAATLASSARLDAQENPPATEKAEAKETKSKSGVVPFNGKLKAFDKTAKTITIGERTIQLTTDTKIVKNGKTATIEDAVVGEAVGGAYKKSDSGTLTATTVRFGPKQEIASEETQKDKKSKK